MLCGSPTAMAKMNSSASWNPSRWYRFKAVGAADNRRCPHARAFLARDDEEDWGYDE